MDQELYNKMLTYAMAWLDKQSSEKVFTMHEISWVMVSAGIRVDPNMLPTIKAAFIATGKAASISLRKLQKIEKIGGMGPMDIHARMDSLETRMGRLERDLGIVQ